MNSKTLATLAGLCIAAPAMAQITSIRSDITTGFIDISGTGTRLTSSSSSNDDCNFSAVGVSNAGITSTTYRMCTNGFVQFGGAAGATTFTNASIPANDTGTSTVSGSSAPQAILPFWDDMVSNPTLTTIAGASTAGVYIQTGTVASFGGVTLTGPGGPVVVGGNMTIVQWNRMDLFTTGNTLLGTFQLMVFDTPVAVGPYTVYALAVFGDMSFGQAAGTGSANGFSATVGHVRGLPDIGNNVQNSFNTAGSVPNGLNLAFVPTPGAAALLGMGALAAGRRRRA